MILQRLKHDKILSKKTFPNFVDSWNFTIDRMMNLKGDKDINPDIGAIQVDNTDPLHPVIRFNAISSDITDENTPPDSNDSENGLSSVEWIWPETSSDTSSDTEEDTEGLDKRPKAFSLFNFGKEENDGTLSVNINQLSGTATPESELSGRYDFLVRHEGVLKYMDLQLFTALPSGGGGGANPISVIGNAPNSQVVEAQNTLRFTSLSDSNVVAQVVPNGEYTDIKIGVYYI